MNGLAVKEEFEVEEHKKHSIAYIAYLILVADGLHNFIDGLAIGSGFSRGLRTGFGIALAVLR